MYECTFVWCTTVLLKSRAAKRITLFSRSSIDFHTFGLRSVHFVKARTRIVWRGIWGNISTTLFVTNTRGYCSFLCISTSTYKKKKKKTKTQSSSDINIAQEKCTAKWININEVTGVFTERDRRITVPWTCNIIHIIIDCCKMYSSKV